MNNTSKQIRAILRLSILGILAGNSLLAQTPNGQIQSMSDDSLSLKQIMNVVIKNHPVVKEAEESLNRADAQIGLARSGYYPNIDVSASFSNVGPAPALTIPDMGSFQLFPHNNYEAGVNVHQSIYDFGKTTANVEYATGSKELAEKSIETTKQNMAKGVIKNYYTLLYLQEAIKIKDEQLKVLEGHLDFVQKKKATGSGTNYEILSTKVKISAVENQKTDIVAARDVQLSILNSLLGLPVKTFHIVKDTLTVSQPSMPDDSVIDYALQHREEMQMALKKTDLASLHLDVVKTENKPSLNFIATGGAKNGFVPNIGTIRANYVLGLGIRIPIFDAYRTKYKIMQATSSIESSSLQSEVTKRNISSEVVESETRLMKDYQKLEQSKLLLSQSEEAFKLAQTNYSAGAITNLDLLDATTTVSESKLMVLKSQIDYAVSIYLFDASLGEHLY